jgi:DNA topoisomerase I
MSKTLFLIEAPGKLKKLKQILGADYIVRASGGHIRELARDGADSLGFEMDGNRVNCRFVPRDTRAKKTIEELKGLVKGVDRVILATDEDREGEAIAWHLKDLSRDHPHRRPGCPTEPQAVGFRSSRPPAKVLRLGSIVD